MCRDVFGDFYESLNQFFLLFKSDFVSVSIVISNTTQYKKTNAFFRTDKHYYLGCESTSHIYRRV